LNLLYATWASAGNVADIMTPEQLPQRRAGAADGIPISLAIVFDGGGPPRGPALEGVSFPCHFLVRAVGENGAPIFVDPFDGGSCPAMRSRPPGRRSARSRAGCDDQLLAPASSRQIIARLLNNLRIIYEVRGDGRRLCQVLARLAIVLPSEEADQRPNAPASTRLAPDQHQLIGRAPAAIAGCRRHRGVALFWEGMRLPAVVLLTAVSLGAAAWAAPPERVEPEALPRWPTSSGTSATGCRRLQLRRQNRRTDAGLILRELGIGPGDVLTPDESPGARRRAAAAVAGLLPAG
jgi:hypothetical protein